MVSYNTQSAFLYNIFVICLASLLNAQSSVSGADALYIEILFNQIEYEFVER